MNWEIAKHRDLICCGREIKFHSKGIKGQLEGLKQEIVIISFEILKCSCCMENGLK